MQRLIGHINLPQAFQSVVNTIALVARYKYVRIFLLKDDVLMLQAQNEKSKVKVQTRNLNEGVVGRVARTGVATLVPNVSLDPDYVEGMPGTQSSIGIPLKRAQIVAGVLLVESDAERTLNANDLHWLVNIGQEISIAIENAELYNDLQEALLQEKAARTQLVRTEKLAGMGRLIASVAHELNNPLQAIQNALFLVKQEANLGGQAKEDLFVALSESERMAELISRLRETYRPTVAEKFQDGSLNALVTETQRLIATHIRHRNITFDFVADPQLPFFSCVPDEIKQVLLNLSLNAVEAMEDGGHLTVRTGHDDDKSVVWVSVSDTGVGIDQTTIANIFDPFFTTKEGGTGLGLFITHEIVQKHGGRVEVESQRNVGTTFTVTFPLNNNRSA
jgi:signal transduction histidine kinase